jgi:hypothetical protein
MVSRKIVAIVALAMTVVAVGGGVAYSAGHNDGTPSGAGMTASPNVAVAGCKTAVTDIVTGGGLTFTTTTPTTFATIPINVKGHVNTCVIVHLTAQAYANGSNHLLFAHALLDGGNSTSGDIQIVGDDPGTFSDSYSYDYVFPSVAPGLHTVVVQGWDLVAGDNTFINDFTASVEHR